MKYHGKQVHKIALGMIFMELKTKYHGNKLQRVVLGMISVDFKGFQKIFRMKYPEQQIECVFRGKISDKSKK